MAIKLDDPLSGRQAIAESYVASRKAGEATLHLLLDFDGEVFVGVLWRLDVASEYGTKQGKATDRATAVREAWTLAEELGVRIVSIYPPEGK